MNKKVTNNAISSYFGLAALLLFVPTKNDLIKNSFVKSHAKTALIIHILMILTYVVFISNRFLEWITLFNYTLNHLITPTILTILFWFLLFWVKKASAWETFMVSDLKQITKSEWLYEVKESNLSEKEAFTIILSYIPFVWFYINSKNKNNTIIENNTKLNLIITVFLLFILISWHNNLFTLFWLFYIIFIVFSWVLLIASKSSININLSKVPSFDELHTYFLSSVEYIKNYTTDREFIWIKEIIKTTSKQKQENLQKEHERLEKLSTNKLKNIIYYIPLINIIWLIDIKSKYQNHIINWVSLSILLVFVSLFLPWYELYVLIAFAFNLWYLWNIAYQTPFLYDIYIIKYKIAIKAIAFYNKVKEKHNANKEVSYKTKESNLKAKKNDINELFTNSKEEKQDIKLQNEQDKKDT